MCSVKVPQSRMAGVASGVTGVDAEGQRPGGVDSMARPHRRCESDSGWTALSIEAFRGLCRPRGVDPVAWEKHFFTVTWGSRS